MDVFKSGDRTNIEFNFRLSTKIWFTIDYSVPSATRAPRNRSQVVLTSKVTHTLHFFMFRNINKSSPPIGKLRFWWKLSSFHCRTSYMDTWTQYTILPKSSMITHSNTFRSFRNMKKFKLRPRNRAYFW